MIVRTLSSSNDVSCLGVPPDLETRQMLNWPEMSVEKSSGLAVGREAIGGVVAGGMKRRNAKNCSNAGGRFWRRACFCGAVAVAIPRVYAPGRHRRPA